MENIAVCDYVYNHSDSRVFAKPKLSEEETIVIHRFTTSDRAVPFLVFEKASLMVDIENVPLILRYAFLVYCCKFSDPPAPPHIRDKFYSYSKAVSRWCLENPGPYSLQALLLLNSCAGSFDSRSSPTFSAQAFRMASFLKLDQHVSTPPTFTPHEENVLDRCWRLCLHSDNLYGIMGNTPRFFRHEQAPMSSINYESPLSSNLDHFISSLSEVMFDIKEAMVSGFDTLENRHMCKQNLDAAESRLAVWKKSVDPFFDMDEICVFVRGTSHHSAGVDRFQVALFMGHQACICLLSQSRAHLWSHGGGHESIRLSSSNESSFDANGFDSLAYKSAKYIGLAAAWFVAQPSFERKVHPLPGYLVLLSGLVLCGFCKRGLDRREEENVIWLIRSEIELLRGLLSTWETTGVWLDTLEREFKTHCTNR
ncbi:hypothetical protein HDU97_005690 [Phlyctochytrium planicorne]|nr:hypothetical protein HDU97_005690 [Phlyctochytrium planicorne]